MKRAQGFTLVELIVVIVLTGIVGAIVAMQLKPALQTYASVAARANLVNQADVALRRIVTDVRVAVPNSLSLTPLPGGQGQCMEMVPTQDGGRYRIAPDAHDATASNAFDAQAATVRFDVLTRLNATGVGHKVVIGNDNAADLYQGANTATIGDLAPGAAGIATSVVTLKDSAIAAGYDGGRFVVIPAAQQIVGYACVQPGIANGRGTGFLRRTVRTIGANVAACSAGAQLVAANVSACSFVYRDNAGATQQSGYLQLQLSLASGGENAALTIGAHVENVP